MISERHVQLLSHVHLETGWYFRNYLIKANASEDIDVCGYIGRLHKVVEQVEEQHLSKEFEYFKVGFIVGHFGRRGVCISVWHWGKWLKTHEMFNQRWYTYGRDLNSLALLGGDEPVFCQFEVPVLVKEFALFHEVASRGFENGGQDKFFGFDPKL